MPTTRRTAPLPAPAPASLDELEELLYAELARFAATPLPGNPADGPFRRGHICGRSDGYADGIATAIHFITGEPVPDITDRVLPTARDHARRAS